MTKVAVSKTKIEAKLGIIRESITELQTLAQLPKKTFVGDKHNFALAEHYLRRSLEAIFDIAGHVLSRFAYSPGKRPITFKDIAVELGKKSIIDKKFANQTLVKMAGYRSRMVHGYAELTSEELYQLITAKQNDLEYFAKKLPPYPKAAILGNRLA